MNSSEKLLHQKPLTTQVAVYLVDEHDNLRRLQVKQMFQQDHQFVPFRTLLAQLLAQLLAIESGDRLDDARTERRPVLVLPQRLSQSL